MITRVVGMVMAVAAGLVPAAVLAAPRTPTPLFSPGHQPGRAMELLPDLALEVSPALGKSGAMEMLRQAATQLGADAVVDVVVQQQKKPLAAAQLAGLPMVVMGGLLSLVTGNPEPLVETTRHELSQGLVRTVLVVRGVPVKFLP